MVLLIEIMVEFEMCVVVDVVGFFLLFVDVVVVLVVFVLFCDVVGG